MAEKPEDYSQRIVDESLREFTQLQTWRNVFAAQWEEVAELILPTSRNTFYYGSWNFPGQKKTDRQVDSTGMLALSRFVAILDSLLTPRNMTWHSLQASDANIMKDRRVRLWFEEVTRLLFKYRYHPMANFSSQNCNHWQGLGAFGNGNLLIDGFLSPGGQVGLRYLELPLGEMYLRENHQKLIDGFCRHFRLTAQQAIQKFVPKGKDVTAVLGEQIAKLAEQSSQMPVEFLHRVCPRSDYEPGRLDPKGKLYASYYICLLTRKLVRESGYTSFPIASSRYEQTPNETYGRSPAMMVLPTLKTLNSVKKDYLSQSHLAGTPAYLTTDDGIVDFSRRPGALNKGGVDEEGRELVKILPTGNIQVTEQMMKEEAGIIDSAFLVDLFKVLLGDPKIYTATQIVEMMSQRGILIAPTVGRQQSEYLGPMIDREIDVLASLHLLPPLPGLLREAKGEYHVSYSSPLTRDMRAQDIAGFQRTVEFAQTIAANIQDPSIMDRFDWDAALPDIAANQSVPESWMADDNMVAAKRQKREQLRQQQAQVQSLPAQAAMLKARAAVAKAGATPEQNAPATPGNAQGQ